VRLESVANLLKKCPLLSELSPHATDMTLNDASSLNLRGYVRVDRKDKLKANPKTWYNSSEIDFMFAFLMRNKALNNMVTIIPVRFVKDIETALDCYMKVSYLVSAELEMKATNTYDRNVFRAHVQDKFGMFPSAVRKAFEKCIDVLYNNLVMNDPNMLDKPLIVFPDNSTEDHWRAIFVFNAGNIDTNSVTKLNGKQFWNTIHGIH